MSRSDKDKAGGHPRRDKPRSGRLDCLCCEVRVPDVQSPQRRVREAAAWGFEFMADGEDQRPWRITPFDQHGHQFFARRCLRCDMRELDLGLLGEEDDSCPVDVTDDPVFYTTTTEGIATLSHRIL